MNTHARKLRTLIGVLALVLASATPAFANTSVSGTGAPGVGGGASVSGTSTCNQSTIGNPALCKLPVGSIPCTPSAIQNMIARYGYASNFSLCTYNPTHGINISSTKNPFFNTDLAMCATGFDVWRFYGEASGSRYTEKGYTVSRIALTQADATKTGCYDPNAKNKNPAPKYYAASPAPADASSHTVASTQHGCEFNSISNPTPNYPAPFSPACPATKSYPGGYGLPVYTLNSSASQTSWANTTFTSEKPFAVSNGFSCSALETSSAATVVTDFKEMAQATNDPTYTIDPATAQWANHFWSNNSSDQWGYVQWYNYARANNFASPAKYANEAMNLALSFAPTMVGSDVATQLTTPGEWNALAAKYNQSTAPCSSSLQYAPVASSSNQSQSNVVFGVCVMPIVASARFAEDTTPKAGQTTIFFPEFTAPSAGGSRYTLFAGSGQNLNAYASWTSSAFSNWRNAIYQEVLTRDKTVVTDPLSKLPAPSPYWAGSPYAIQSGHVNPLSSAAWSTTKATQIAQAAAAYAQANAQCSVGNNAAAPVAQPAKPGPNLTVFVNPIKLLGLGDALNPQPVQISSLPFQCVNCAAGASLVGFDATVKITASTGYQMFHLLDQGGSILATSTALNGEQTLTVHVNADQLGTATFYLGFRNATTASQHVTITIESATAKYQDGAGPLSFVPTIGWAKYPDAYPASISVPVASGTITPGH